MINEKAKSSENFKCGLRDYFYENNCNYSSYKVVWEIALTGFFLFSKNLKREASFQQFVGLLAKHVSLFCLKRFRHHFKDMFTSANFQKERFLDIIPVPFSVLYLKASVNKIY